MVNILKNLENYHIVLASNSPRRKELLKGLGVNFEVRVLGNIDETYPSSMSAMEVPLFLAQKKAQAYLSALQSDDLLITADTIVCLDEKIMGKPQSEEEAKQMLSSLSGKEHSVITGVALTTKTKQKSFSAESKVLFADLTDEEIQYYIDCYKPFDKAGSYGIQEWIGMIGVKGICGSFFNVMGLPVQRLYTELKMF